MKLHSSAWVLLGVGLAIRSVAINQPLLDAHLIRQCQTAAATKSLLQQPGLHLSAKIPWLGDHNAHYILELPFYNYLVCGMELLAHDVDLSGKLTTILLWTGSFVCLQLIWRRVLSQAEAFWANLLFVFAPLSVFFGQAFTPEMLIQLLGFVFVLMILRYAEAPTLTRWWICAAIGALAAAVKTPEVAHLYLLIAFVLGRRNHWIEFFKPRYWLAATLTFLLLKLWSGYVDQVNSINLPEWTSGPLLRGFIGPPGARFQFHPWSMIALYVCVLIFSGPATIAAIYGLRQLRQKTFLSAWLVTLALFYFLWFGNGATGQSYYNLPALAPMCALFGAGTAALLSKWRAPIWRFACATLVIVPALPIYSYLFTQDRQLHAAITWTKANTQPADIILVRCPHRWDLVEYPQNAIVAYYTDRPTFVYTRYTPESIQAEALARSRYAIVTQPQQTPSNEIVDLLRRYRAPLPQAESTDWLREKGFRLREDEPGLQVFERPPATFDSQ